MKLTVQFLAAAAIVITGALLATGQAVPNEWWGIAGALVGVCVRRPGDVALDELDADAIAFALSGAGTVADATDPVSETDQA